MFLPLAIIFLTVGLGVFIYIKGNRKDSAQTHELSSDVSEIPILSLISYFLGVILILFGIIAFTYSLNQYFNGKPGFNEQTVATTLLLFISGLIQIGIGQVIDFLAKTSYYCFLISKSIQPIDAKLIVIQKEIASLSAQKENFNESSISSIQNYYWMIDGKQFGPEKLNFVKNLFHGGVITLDSQIFREGENIWLTVKDCPEITS